MTARPGSNTIVMEGSESRLRPVVVNIETPSGTCLGQSEQLSNRDSRRLSIGASKSARMELNGDLA